MKKSLLIIFISIGYTAFAQVPEDALRYSWLSHSGTARYMSIGGAMGSLGGDITAAYVNPAGLGFYRTGEVALTPAFLQNKNNISFRDAPVSSTRKNSFNLGTIGIVNGFSMNGDPKSYTSWAFAVNQTANFNNEIRYNALNNYSSFTEQFAEEFAKSGLSIDDVLNTGSALPFTAAPALFTYLIDTVWDGNKYVVRGASENILDAGQALRQELYRKTNGGIYDLAFSVAGNVQEKLFLGVTAGIPLIHYKSKTVLTESDTSSNTANLFKTATFTDNFETNGVGLNLKLGVIYRSKEYIRLGFALHTPSFISQTDKRTTSVFSAKEGTDTARIEFADSGMFSEDTETKNTYIQQTPWKAMISGSYVFREVSDVRKQRGFISADIEYVNQKSSRFRVDEESKENEPKKTYYKSLNKTVKDNYKGAFNFRVGGELKFNVIMARLGFAYYSNPYKDKVLKANRTMLSGGLGYRHKGFFVDVAYVHQKTKDVHFPYRLEDRENTFANIKQIQGNFSATVGIKF